MTTFRLSIECDNAAFAELREDEPCYERPLLDEVSRILDLLAKNLAGNSGRLFDRNGNTVGAWEIEA